MGREGWVRGRKVTSGASDGAEVGALVWGVDFGGWRWIEGPGWGGKGYQWGSWC